MLTRRAFLATGICAASLLKSSTSGAQGAAVTRRAARSLAGSDSDLAAYSVAVARMKALPASDPRNWNRFADIHRNFCPHGNWYFLPWHRAYITTLERICRDLSGKADFALPYWDWTSERRLPAAFTSGNPRTNPLNHARPAFAANEQLADDMVGPSVIARVLASPDFEAFGSSRPSGQNGTGTQWQRREGTRTELEFNPHDGVHMSMGGDMAQAPLAARDPIFYLHHANIDRVWATWNARGNENTNDRLWRNFEFNRQFPNPDGSDSEWAVSVADVVATADLGYRYESETIGSLAEDPMAAYAADPVLLDRYTLSQDTAPAETHALPAPSTPRQAIPERHQMSSASREISGASEVRSGLLADYRRLRADALPRSTRELRRIPLQSGGAVRWAAAQNQRYGSREMPLHIPVSLGRPLGDVVQPAALAQTRGSQQTQAARQFVWATIRDIEPPADPNTRVRVYVNCTELSPGTPVSHPQHVTTLSFFGARHGAEAHTGHAHHHHAMAHQSMRNCVSVDLGPALARMANTRHFRDDKIVVQLMPVCPKGTAEGSRVRSRQVEIAIL